MKSASPDATAFQPPLARLADFLADRRPAILAAWRKSCESSSNLHPSDGLTQDEFYDHIPALLKVLELRLRLGEHADDNAVTQKAREHGLHRWQKGYTLQEILSEITCLHECLIHEVRNYQVERESLNPDALLLAHSLVSKLVYEAIGGSVNQYSTLQKFEAASRAEGLQQALDQVNELVRQRGDLLRMASHDLYSSFGVIQGAAFILDQPEITEEERTEMLQMLQRNFPKITALLTQLMDLARLEAGQESLHVESFDAAELMRGLLESMQPFADERSLYLRADGPAHLPVEGDPVKVYRVAQNLLLNALKYTPFGGVSLQWSRENALRWVLTVRDTGPGLSPRSAAWLADPTPSSEEFAELFREITESEPASAALPATSTATANDSLATAVLSAPAVYQPESQGIGLYIVKRLCELLNASMDVETHPGAGTAFKIRLPVQYDKKES
jgi:signal transduction histidine kinase